ncbi:hypothetical protein [Novacetimonas hansenii]|nr:hypothetical protein [Novacetimonas hansenii]WEQ60188.1 hypothetical protein LV563_06780 [Novacetimonas hansenii]
MPSGLIHLLVHGEGEWAAGGGGVVPCGLNVRVMPYRGIVGVPRLQDEAS